MTSVVLGLEDDPVRSGGVVFLAEIGPLKGNIHVAFWRDVIETGVMYCMRFLSRGKHPGLPFLAGVILVVFAQNWAFPSLASNQGSVPGPKVRVSTPAGAIAEGRNTTFSISRDATQGNLVVTFRVSGDAELGKDYILRRAERLVAGQMRVTIPRGRASVELGLEALDDVTAETDETIVLTLEAGEGYRVDEVANSVAVRIARNDFAVTTTGDTGEGSLRQAILNANAIEGADTVRFDTTIGPFETPQTIVLANTLPDLAGEVVIDGYIPGRVWKASGVTVSGAGKGRLFTVVPGALVTISSLTVADGYARDGGGILNRGELVVKSVTFVGNEAERCGGGLAGREGTLTVINSTFADNIAGEAGGGLAEEGGKATVTNCTFSGNRAKKGGGIFSSGMLLLRNTILANSEEGADCVCVGVLDPASTKNIIESHTGCGEPISTADPRLMALGSYNGPTHTFPLGVGSPAVNLGDNASAVDQYGEPLKWDQRGNGDPRFVAGITDIGAFERQVRARLVVDTFEDTELCGCSPSGRGDCSLRGAITLANATEEPDVITFDPDVFTVPRTIVLTYPLPDLVTDITIDATGTAGVTVTSKGRFDVLRIAPEAEVELIGIRIEDK